MSEGLKVWRSRMARTTRGAIFKAKRWFYSVYYNKSIPDEIKEKSKENWARLARLLVEKSNAEGISDKAATLTIYYYEKDGVFVPVGAEIEAYEIKPLKTVKISEEELASA